RTDDGVRTAALIIAGVLAVASVIGDSVGGLDFPWPLMLVGLVLLVVFGSKQAKENRASAADSLAPPPPGGSGASYETYRPWQPPRPPWPTDPRRRGPLLFPFTVALIVLALGAVGTMDLAGVDVVPSAYPATVLGVVGVMLVVGAFFGRAGGLILIGLVAALATAATSVVGNDHVGEVRESPDSAAELEAGYDLAIGDMVIDLTDIPADELDQLAGRTLEVDARIGHIRVIVPDDGLRVEADARVVAGETVLFGEKSDNSEKASYGDPTEPTLEVEADLFLGQIEVLTEKEAAA
ncbi:MAG TPA: LiaF domain-containing protein, partial [Nocardioides sp.]|nr:LiaF domain-containing protein [Nocardioides sp.]